MSSLLDQIYIRLYLGNERDEEVAQYLAKFERGRQGTKTDEAKRLMYLGLQALEEESQPPDLAAIREIVSQELAKAGVSAQQVDSETIRQAVQEAVQETIGDNASDTDIDLTGVRRVVDAALSEALNGLRPGAEGAEDTEAEAEEAEALLDKLTSSL